MNNDILLEIKNLHPLEDFLLPDAGVQVLDFQ